MNSLLQLTDSSIPTILSGDGPPTLTLRNAITSAPAQWSTDVRVGLQAGVLRVRFDCHDAHIWGTFYRRDDPLYDEEVVEVFIGAGEGTPVDYYEFELSPWGVLFDARIHNPNGRNDSNFQVDEGWNCPGLTWACGSDPAAQRWWAEIGIPLTALHTGPAPNTWRLNVYRIERPAAGPPEYTAWCPTLADPVDFHRPHLFGRMTVGDDGGRRTTIGP